MHIPSCSTQSLPVVPFDAALTQALEPSPDYDITRWIYVPNHYGEYRYILGTRGQHPLICVGINPSTAAPDDLDNTLKSVERVALHNGLPGPTTWSRNATRPSTGRICVPLTMPCPWTQQAGPPCGPPGVPSLKSEITCRPASGI